MLLRFQNPVYAGDAIPIKDYQLNLETNFPDILNIGTVLESGIYKIQLMAQPVISKSSNSLVADWDMKYIIIRIGITNNGEETIGWFSPDSFHIQEIYLNHTYGTYKLDTILSAKASVGYSQPFFYSPIEPGKMLQTALVFEICPEAQGWILKFTPNTLGSEKSDILIQFQLPKALMQ